MMRPISTTGPSRHIFTIILLSVVVRAYTFIVSPNGASLQARSAVWRATPSLTQRQVAAGRSMALTSLRAAAISPGDTVLVIGGTGGVGQLVTKKLLGLGCYNVRVTSRDLEKGMTTLDDDTVDFVALDLVSKDNAGALEAAMKGASAVVISVGTTAFPTGKWKGGNTPEAIDKIAVQKIATAAKVPGMKKIVLLTSVGVDRTTEMPFLILNLFGVLDAKKSGEQSVMDAATDGGFDYTVLRPGRLVGGPYTNPDVAKLLQSEGGTENGVTVEVGDSLLGDCKRDACAEAVIRCLTMEECKNIAFSIVSNDEKALTSDDWGREFTRMANQ